MKKWNLLSVCILIVTVLTFAVIDAGAAYKYGYYDIWDDATGGDCTQIGIWDATTKTCTLTGDITLTGQDYWRGISIRDNGITLDGNGYTLTGPPKRIGVAVDRKSGFTVKNLKVKENSTGLFIDYYSGGGLVENNDFQGSSWSGIVLRHSSDILFKENSVSNCYIGVRSEGASGNEYVGNSFHAGAETGLQLIYISNDNIVRENVISGSYTGFTMQGFDNEIYNNTIYGFGLYYGSDNLYYNNNFLDGYYRVDSSYTNNVFNLDKPTGGNYWKMYDSPADGCEDFDEDGFCDESFTFSKPWGGTIVDNLPYVKYDGWVCQSAPTFEITSFGPEEIWPPNNKKVDITVSGYIVLPDGCSLISSSYSFVDEYGAYSGTGELEVAEDGSFSMTLQGEAIREGADKDGRTYSLVLYATDEVGEGSSEALVSTVAHDQRK